MRIEQSAATDIGRQRKINQDAYGVRASDVSQTQGQLLVVCDGMGGHLDGEIASKLGVETILQVYYESDPAETDQRLALQRAFAVANEEIYKEGRGKMGTTGVAALFLDDTLHVANVGDSRAYLIRDGTIRQISHDHSFVWEQVAAGVLTPEEARSSNHRNMITRALGYRPDVEVDLLPSETLQPGDIVLLSSDGLHSLVEDTEMARVVDELSPPKAVQHLIQMANERGGADNITVIIARVAEGDSHNLPSEEPTPPAVTDPSEAPTLPATNRRRTGGSFLWRTLTVAALTVLVVAAAGGAAYAFGANVAAIPAELRFWNFFTAATATPTVPPPQITATVEETATAEPTRTQTVPAPAATGGVPPANSPQPPPRTVPPSPGGGAIDDGVLPIEPATD